MSITLKKTFAGVALLAFLAFGAPTAKAQSVSELQAMIAALQAQIAALAGGSSSSSCTYVHTVTLKQGSTGSQVAAMQAVIGATADGKFGPMTKAKVQAFQASKGLVADGVVGPMTGAAIAASCSMDDDSSNDDSSSADLEGSFGTIDTVTTLSQYSNEEIGEGADEVKVLGFEVEASNDGDIMINSVKLNFDPAGNGSGDSDNLDDYIDGVTIWMGSKEVGSADAEDFTENSNDTFTRTISLKNAIVRAAGWRYNLYAKGKEPIDRLNGNRIDQRGATQFINANLIEPQHQRYSISGIGYVGANQRHVVISGINNPCTTAYREGSVFTEISGSMGETDDASFKMDTLVHEAPIFKAHGWNVSLRREIQDQYGHVVGMKFIDTGVRANGRRTSTQGFTGDIYIGPYSWVKKGYVSDKVGDTFSTPQRPRTVCDSPDDLLLQSGDCTGAGAVGPTNDGPGAGDRVIHR